LGYKIIANYSMQLSCNFFFMVSCS